MPLKIERKKERKKDILTSCKRPKWPIRPNKRLHRKCCLVLRTTNKNKNKYYSMNLVFGTCEILKLDIL